MDTPKQIFKYLLIMLCISNFLSCGDSSDEEENEPITEFDGTYFGIIETNGIQLGTFSLTIDDGEVEGTYTDGNNEVDFDSEVSSSGRITITLTLSDNTKVEAKLKIEDDEITGSWSSDDNEEGTLLGAVASDTYDGDYEGSVFIGSSMIGSFDVNIKDGRLTGSYTEDGDETDINGFVNEDGETKFNINFGDGLITSVTAQLEDGEITGTFSNTDGESGTIATKGAIQIEACPLTITDIDGNVYNVVTIGSQCWTAENLKTTKYRNGDALLTYTDGDNWNNATSGAYANYDNNSSNGLVYGKLYNAFAVMDPRGLCPTGWHVPTKKDAAILLAEIGDNATAGGQLKSTGTIDEGGGSFLSPNVGATNAYGFNGMPGGRRSFKLNIGAPFDYGVFMEINYRGVWWSSSVSNDTHQYVLFSLENNDESIQNVNLSIDKNDGHSCRCIRD